MIKIILILAFSISILGCGVSQSDHRAAKADLDRANEIILELKSELEVKQSTCSSASKWRVAAQELAYTSNDMTGTREEYIESFYAAFVPLANITIPSIDRDPNSELLPLMKLWTRQMEKYHSLLAINGSTDEIESSRLEMNATIADVNALLKSECQLEPLILYQPHP